MTLVLAPPGHGKSLLLKALAGQLRGDRRLTGDLRWNGLDSRAADAAAVQVNRLCAYVDQGEAHMSLLTVRETLQFALDSSVASPTLMAPPGSPEAAEYAQAAAAKVDLIIDVLGLRECQHTILGNAMLRGVSGGQKRRVSVGEMLVTNARALFLDEITTGLDSATSYDILHTLRAWTRIMRGSVVTALLQPTPECFELFDRLILLRQGCVVYDGPVALVTKYLASVGVTVPDDQDLADFLTDFLTDPTAVCERTWKKAAVSNSAAPRPDPAQLTTAALAASFAPQRGTYTDISAEGGSAGPPSTSPLTSPFNAAQFSSPFPHPFLTQLRLNVKRQSLNMIRNKSLYIPRLVQSVFMGLILGGLFYQFSPSRFQARLGLALFASTFVAFSNAAEISFTGEHKLVVFKQFDAGFYGSPAYAVAVFLVHLPLSITEITIFTLFLYFMTGFAAEAGRYFFFLLMVWSISLCSSSIFRMLTYLTPRNDVALQVAGPTIAFMFLFGGYLIDEPQIPRWLVWLFWLSPFSWYLRSVAINEYDASRYDDPFPDQPYLGLRTGDAYDREWGINPLFAYKWAGVGYIWGLTFIMVGLAMLVLRYVRYPISTGTRRSLEDEQTQGKQETLQVQPVSSLATPDEAKEAKVDPLRLPRSQSAAHHQRGSQGSASSVLPFEPIHLAWQGITYSVPVKAADGTTAPRVLLHSIDGFCRAGTLTALMGSSGAGKTTLMDVIAGRKTQGSIEGTISVNGHPQQLRTFNRLCGYVEQVDTHLASQTVREALHFSATLRLPPSVSAERRRTFVEEVLDILELTAIAGRVIGDAALPGLSPGQLKRVTIGVELVANPAVLFLDEPTSGLDSRAALVVMRVVARIASTGRTVLCTIHQPSRELFAMFDRLLLLGRGGVQIYAGPLGEDGQQLVSYLQEAAQAAGAGPLHKPKTTNPASWMLDVLGSAQMDAAAGVDFAAAYQTSDLRQRNAVDLAELSQPTAGSQAVSYSSVYAATVWTQLQAVCYRTFQFYWRSPGMVWLRIGNMLLLSNVFGFLYLQEGVSSTANVIAQLSAVFVGIAFPGWSSMSVVIPLTVRKRLVFYREQASLMYSPLVYAFSLCLVEVVYTALATTLFLSCYYEMVGFRNDASGFFRYWLAEYLVLLVIVSLGQLCASAMPNELVANLMSSLVFTFAFLFSGIYILADQLPAGWKWLYRIFWIPKALIPIISDQFYCEGPECPQLTNVLSPDGQLIPQVSVSDFLLSYLDTGRWYWQYIGWQLLTYAVMQALVWLAIAKINHVKR